jgi:hypothetical protein
MVTMLSCVTLMNLDVELDAFARCVHITLNACGRGVHRFFRPLVPFIEITGSFVLVTGGRMSELISVASEKTIGPISI